MIRVLAAVALACLGLSPALADAKRKPLRCQALKGKIEIATKDVKVVRTKDRDGFAVLRGCQKPNGIVRILGREEDEGLGSSTIGAVAAKGWWVLIDYEGSNQYARFSSAWLADARTGRRNQLFSNTAITGDPGYDRYFDALAWDAQGRAVTIVGTPHGYENFEPTNFTETVSVHAPDSTRIAVDTGTREEIPPSSLSFDTGTAHWTHGGAQRTAIFG